MRAFGTLLALLACMGAAVSYGQPEDVPAERELERAFHGPLQDAECGRLYESAARLLESARELPRAVDLDLRKEPEEPSRQAGAVPEEQPAAPEEAAEPTWVAAVEGPVIDQERMAYIHLVAGNYEQAVQLYTTLHDGDPEDQHLTAMLMLSLHNAGRTDEARALKEQLDQDGRAGPWADWLFEVAEICRTPSEESR